MHMHATGAVPAQFLRVVSGAKWQAGGGAADVYTQRNQESFSLHLKFFDHSLRYKTVALQNLQVCPTNLVE